MFLRLLLICFFLPVFVSDSSGQTDRNSVVDAISSGNSARLSSWFAPSVAVVLPAHNGNFSCNQARVMLQEFFRQYTSKSFTLTDSGKTSQSNHFILGTYISEEGTRFSVYVLFSTVSGRERITRITFETN